MAKSMCSPEYCETELVKCSSLGRLYTRFWRVDLCSFRHMNISEVFSRVEVTALVSTYFWQQNDLMKTVEYTCIRDVQCKILLLVLYRAVFGALLTNFHQAERKR